MTRPTRHAATTRMNWTREIAIAVFLGLILALASGLVVRGFT